MRSMRTLNCKHTTRMIALFVAGDLVGAPEREVATHLAACDGCRQLAEEFSESSSLLTQACPPPAFEAEFYSGIRCAVLAEIASAQMVSKRALFRPRWLYATAFAAIVIVSGLMLQQFVAARREPPKELAALPPATAQPTSKPSDVQAPQEEHEPGTLTAQANKDSALANPRGSSTHFAAKRKSDAPMTTQAALVNNTQIAQAEQSLTSVGSNAAESATSAGALSSSSSRRASASEVSRIEIQTSDPNIRIIWLSPRESSEPAETDHDQDPRQNGNRK